jgi:chaperonin GroES
MAEEMDNIDDELRDLMNAEDGDETEVEAPDEQSVQGQTRLVNIAEHLDDDQVDQIGTTLLTEVRTDIDSRKDWLDRVENWIELATQVTKEKSHPWPGASNIKYPLLQTAAVQFHARAFPALLGNTTPVRGKVIGRDPMGIKANRADRVGTFMSYQVLYDMKDWVDDMDRALLILPLLGAVYKKTYFNPNTSSPVSEIIHPRDFIINYDAREFHNARKTHRIWKTPNEIKENQNRGIYREFEGDDIFQAPKTASQARDDTHGLNNPGVEDPYTLQEMYEVHCLLDLDEDGYREPYIVTLRESDGKVYRITEGFNQNEVDMSEDGSILAIRPKTYFTAYFFMPDPESKTHGLGFGTIVGPLNEAVNTIINQLTDAGTLSNLQGGFLGRGVRLKGGDISFKPGEWKNVNATGEDIRKGIFPMPVREPSNVLFTLLGTLIDSGKDLTSVQDLMVGKNPGQNQPFSTSQMVMEQGLKVFNGIYKRLYRSMSDEFQLLFEVNGEHLNIQKYMEVLDDQGQEIMEAMQEHGPQAVMKFLAQDWNTEDMDVIPTAEPDMVAEVQRAMKAESLMGKVEMGLPINPQVALRRMLEAEQHENIEELLEMPEPQPDPEVVLKERELEIREVEASIKAQVAEADVMLKETQAEVLLIEGESKEVERMHGQFMKEKEERRKEFEALTGRLKETANANKARTAGSKSGGTTG